MLPADLRLRKNADFRLVYKRGRENVHPLAVLYVMRRSGASAVEFPGPRIGFVVSKKQGNAVVRNRIKRRLREAARLRLPELREGAYDLVFVARGRLKTATWPEVQEAARVLLKRGGVLMEQDSGFRIQDSGRAVRGGEGQDDAPVATPSVISAPPGSE